MNYSVDFNKNMSSLDIYIKPTYSFLSEDKWSIEYPTKSSFIIDSIQLEKIINSSKRFVFHNINDKIPSYGVNYRRMSLFEFLLGVNPNYGNYNFKNENKNDIRTINVCFTKPSFYNLTKKYNVINYLNNEKLVKKGRYSGELKNYMCEIKTQDNKQQFLMECNNNTLCILCPKSYQILLDFEKKCNKKIIWTQMTNGYILGNNNLYIHQVITGCHGNGKGTKNISVDHIDQDPLNNTFDNLRIVSQKIQQQNTTGIKEGSKRERKSNAKPLPDGINQNMLKKYVYYCEETYGHAGKKRQFFRIEKHPKLEDKRLSSSKSDKFSILEKLAQANKIVEDLDKGIYVSQEKKLPLYVSKRICRDREHFIFDKKTEDGQRLNLKMILPEEYDFNEQISIFNEKIKSKYNIEIV